MASPFQFVHVPESGTQFNSLQFFSLSLNNNANDRRLVKGRKTARPSSSDAEKPMETASKLPHENIEPRIGEKKNNTTEKTGVLAPSDIIQGKVARQANQYSVSKTAWW